MKSLLAGFILALLSQVALAGEPACFERRYNDAHMQKHKLQEVTAIRLNLSAVGLKMSGQIKAGFRELPEYLSSTVNCAMTAETNICKVQKNGGTFDFIFTDKGIKLTNQSKIRFGGEDDGVTIGDEAEHKVFLLFPVACDQ